MHKREKRLARTQSSKPIGKGFVICSYCGATLDEITEKIKKLLQKRDKNNKNIKNH